MEVCSQLLSFSHWQMSLRNPACINLLPRAQRYSWMHEAQYHHQVKEGNYSLFSMGEGGLGILWPDLPPPNGLQRSLPSLSSLRLCDESCSLGAHLLCGKAVLESWQSHQGRIKTGVRGSGVNRARYLHYVFCFVLFCFVCVCSVSLLAFCCSALFSESILSILEGQLNLFDFLSHSLCFLWCLRQKADSVFPSELLFPFLPYLLPS